MRTIAEKKPLPTNKKDLIKYLTERLDHAEVINLFIKNCIY